jgi:hypothetical protein
MAAANKEILVPIRIDLDVEGQRFRDTFLWNLNEKTLTLEFFAENLCRDRNIESKSLTMQIAQSIRQQLEDYQSFSNFFEVEEDDRMTVEVRRGEKEVPLKQHFHASGGGFTSWSSMWERYFCEIDLSGI